MRESLDAIMARLEELRRERGLPDGRDLVSHEVVGQLLDQETSAPLANFTVRAFDLDDGAQPRSLGSDLTNHQGLFALVYATPRETTPVSERNGHRLRLHILDPQKREIHQTEVQVGADQRRVLQVQVPVPAAPEPPAPTVTKLASASRVELPEELRTYLSEKDIHTLADIRKAGGLSHLEELPVAADSQAVRMLEAHANLSTLGRGRAPAGRIVPAFYSLW